MLEFVWLLKSIYVIIFLVIIFFGFFWFYRGIRMYLVINRKIIRLLFVDLWKKKEYKVK